MVNSPPSSLKRWRCFELPERCRPRCHRSTAIRCDELQALLLREQGDGLSTEEQADVQELRRRGALPPALPAPEPEAESVQWWIGYVLFFPLGVAWLAMTALPWWLGLTLGALLVVWMWQRPRRARMKAT
jgi:Flp pilus assembly protein TadB